MFWQSVESYLVSMGNQRGLFFGLLALFVVFSQQLPGWIVVIGWGVFCAASAAKYRVRTHAGWIVYPIFLTAILVIYKAAYILGEWADKLVHH